MAVVTAAIRSVMDAVCTSAEAGAAKTPRLIRTVEATIAARTRKLLIRTGCLSQKVAFRG
ncbi:hypothetical protein Aut01nite_41340 [Actinoplanes utahensis]|nr:hypothetical protein Aut01nite_41340 [Actinoplanes utahensis]